jgi:hypothetical protein
MGQTVNLLSYDFQGSNPCLPTGKMSVRASVECENYFALAPTLTLILAEVAHLVEHQPSKLRVAGSSPVFRSLKAKSEGLIAKSK